MELELRRSAPVRPLAPQALQTLSRLSGRRYLAAYLLALFPALLLAVAQPLWSRVDEAQHADFISQLVHGVYPIEGKTTLQPEIAALTQQTGVYRWDPDGQRVIPSEAGRQSYEVAPSGLAPAEERLWVRRHLWRFSYEAMQPPLFYLVAAPVWAGARLGGTMTAAFAVRLLDALLLALLAPLTLIAARLVLPAGRLLQAAAVLVVALLPGLVLNGTTITNDTLAAVLATVPLVLALRALRRGWSFGASFWAGLALGLALLAKLTAAGLVPALALSHAYSVLDAPRGGRRRQAGMAALTLGLPWVLLLPWLFMNWRIYGSLTASTQAHALLSPALPAQPFSFNAPLNLWTTFWTGEPVNTLPAVQPVLAVALAWTLAAACGLVLALWRRRELFERRPLLVCAVAVAGAAIWAPLGLALSHIGGLPPGRYLYPAVVPLAILLVAGAWALARTRGLVLALSAYLLVSAMNLGGLAAGWTGLHSPPRPTPSLLVSVNGWGRYEGVVVSVDEGGIDFGGHAWIHLTVRNSGSTAAELWMTPRVLAGSHSYRAQPAPGSSFPERLEPGAEASGWIALTGVPSNLLDHPLFVKLDGVATDGYEDVGKIVFPVMLG